MRIHSLEHDISTGVYPENIGEIPELFRSREITELRRNPESEKNPVTQGKLGKIRNFAFKSNYLGPHWNALVTSGG